MYLKRSFVWEIQGGDTRVMCVNFAGKSFALGCVRQGRCLVCDRLNLEFDRDPPLTRGG